MYQQWGTQNTKQTSARVGWNDRTYRLIEKSRKKSVFRTASLLELRAFSAQARTELDGLVPDSVLERVYEHNPNVFQVISLVGALDQSIGFIASIPLTESGYQALVTGQFTQADPDLTHIAVKGQSAAAIYVWLIYTPKSFIACASALSGIAADLSKDGCDLFCRGATKASYDFMVSIGHHEAALSFPKAPTGLLVMHPVRDIVPSLYVQVAHTITEIMQIIAIRSATYISEQECPFDEEFDGNDFCAAHLIGYINNEPAGCIRVRFFADFVKFERLAVRHEFRQSRLAFRLVREAMRYAARKGYRKVYGHARHDLVSFWKTFGFREIAEREQFSFSDVAYIEMQGAISSNQHALAIGDDPLVLIRPEGAWSVPGPLERAPLADRAQRIEHIFR